MIIPGSSLSFLSLSGISMRMYACPEHFLALPLWGPLLGFSFYFFNFFLGGGLVKGLLLRIMLMYLYLCQV